MIGAESGEVAWGWDRKRTVWQAKPTTFGERLNEKRRKEDVQDDPKMSYLTD